MNGTNDINRAVDEILPYLKHNSECNLKLLLKEHFKKNYEHGWVDGAEEVLKTIKKNKGV